MEEGQQSNGKPEGSASLSLDEGLYFVEELIIGSAELQVRLFKQNPFRSTEKASLVCCMDHGKVIVAVSSCKGPETHGPEAFNSLSLAVGLPEDHA